MMKRTFAAVCLFAISMSAITSLGCSKEDLSYRDEVDLEKKKLKIFPIFKFTVQLNRPSMN